MTPLFSVCHSTARPNMWRKVFRAYVTSGNQSQMEYILGVEEDRKHEFESTYPEPFPYTIATHDLLANGVNGANCAAAASRGKILVMATDDMYPPEGWDRKILDAVRAAGQSPDSEWVLAPWPINGEGTFLMQICSRAYYNRTGYVFCPAYQGVYADVDWTRAAYHYKAVIDARDTVQFDHRHHGRGLREMDEIDRRHADSTRYAHDLALFEVRKATGFPRR